MGGGVHVSHRKLPKIELDYAAQAWVIVLVASMFFFYEFIQMNMFNAISVPFMHAFHIDATVLGVISSYYFIANVVFLFVAGILLDRFSMRGIMLWSLGICVIGTALFGASDSVTWATIFRFFTGIGSAFCFLSCIRLASRWFPPKRMALVVGVVVTMAMVGGTVAQTPLTLLVEHLGWREALYIDAGLGVFVWIIIALVVRDYPRNVTEEEKREHCELSEIGYWRSLRLAFLRWQNWMVAVYTSLMNLPLILLGGLWGTLYLVNTHGMTRVDASGITSMLFVGTIIGSPLAGWISDRMALRKAPMLWGAAISLGLVLAAVYVNAMTYDELLVTFFLIGFFTSTQIISYAYAAESSPRMITAMSVSVVNITTMAGVGVFQPVFGFLMDTYHRDHSGHSLASVHHVIKYTAADFHWAMLLFPVGIVLAFIAVLLVRETHGKTWEENLEAEAVE